MNAKIIQYKWTPTLRPVDTDPIWPYVNEPVDLIFADPPYNYGVKYDGDETKDKLTQGEYRQLVDATMFKLSRMVKPGGTLWWLCPAEQGEWLWGCLCKYGFLLYDKPIIWYERFSQYQQTRLTSDYRLLFPLIGGGQHKVTTFNPDDIRVKSVRQLMGDPRANPAGRVPGHLWVVSRLQGNANARVDWHNAQLPPEPLETIVKGWTNPGDTVLDAFCGSASMGVVCKRLGRNFVGIDGSEKYCKLARQRIREAPSAE